MSDSDSGDDVETTNFAWDVAEFATSRGRAAALGGGDGGAESTEFDTLDPITSSHRHDDDDEAAAAAAASASGRPGAGAGGGGAGGGTSAVPLAEIVGFMGGGPG